MRVVKDIAYELQLLVATGGRNCRIESSTDEVAVVIDLVYVTGDRLTGIEKPGPVAKSVQELVQIDDRAHVDSGPSHGCLADSVDGAGRAPWTTAAEVLHVGANEKRPGKAWVREEGAKRQSEDKPTLRYHHRGLREKLADLAGCVAGTCNFGAVWFM